MEYEVDIEGAIATIRKDKAKRVLLQLPDGLKPQAKEFVDRIRTSCNCQAVIWAGSCYGSCDLPVGIDKMGFDLLLHFGHTEWK